MPQLTYEDIANHHPDIILPPEREFADEYFEKVSLGRGSAKNLRVAMVAICRNAMPFLPLTIQRVTQTGEMFKDWKCFVFENDSVDGTKEYLASLPRDGKFFVTSTDNGLPHLNFSKTSDRTIPLAEYRNACRGWARENAADFDYCIVFDTDAWGGWSVDGIANTIGHLEDYEYAAAAGMGSYSWAVWGPPVWPQPTRVQYDAWACRWNWWEERQDMLWFHLWHPPVGSPPIRMNSCFGQLAVYRMGNYLEGVYRGGDCEHVHHWRTCGGDCYLNPSQRAVAFWVPDSDDENKGGGLHSDLHDDVACRDADPGDSRDSQDIG